MRRSHSVGRPAVALLAIALMMTGAAAGGTDVALAKSAKKDKSDKSDTATASRGSAPPGVTLNACGCYRKGDACVCTNKNAKCECPEDCEPVGCEAKRQKEMDREVAAEVKRAEDEDKKRQAADAENTRKASEAEAAREKAEEGPGNDDDSAGAPAAEKAAEPAAAEKPADKPPAKAAHKTRAKKEVK